MPKIEKKSNPPASSPKIEKTEVVTHTRSVKKSQTTTSTAKSSTDKTSEKRDENNTNNSEDDAGPVRVFKKQIWRPTNRPHHSTEGGVNEHKVESTVSDGSGEPDAPENDGISTED